MEQNLLVSQVFYVKYPISFFIIGLRRGEEILFVCLMEISCSINITHVPKRMLRLRSLRELEEMEFSWS